MEHDKPCAGLSLLHISVQSFQYDVEIMRAVLIKPAMMV